MTTSSGSLRTHLSIFAATVALSLGACAASPEGDTEQSVGAVQCPASLQAWTPTISYKVGDLVTFQGAIFQCRVAHTPAPNWDPIGAASLWSRVDCANGGGAPPPPGDGGNGGGGGGGTIGTGGVFDADIRALIDERFFILKVSATSDPARNFTQVTNVGRAGMTDIKSLIANGQAQVTTSTANGTEDIVVTVGTERRLQIRRNKGTGFLEGVMVGAASDLKAPFAMSVGNVNGKLTHVLVVDVGNNLKNDLRGTAAVDNQVVETGADSALQLNGGLHAFAEGIQIVTDLQFPGIKGF